MESHRACGHCPVPAGSPCAGLHARRLCELADPAHAHFRPSYRELLVRMAHRPEAEAGPVEPPGHHPVRPLAETIDLLRRMHDCPDRDPRADCGCAGLARCAQGHGRGGLVGHHDCLDCLATVQGRAGVPTGDRPPPMASSE